MSAPTDDALPLRVAVIGSGPHAMSLLSRIVDDSPDLLDEGERSHIAAKAGSRALPHAAVKKALRRRFDGPAILEGVAVFDTHGEWMSQWASDFSALEIEHCRSHEDLHPCPHDFQSLRVWTALHKRQAESWHMHYLDREAARASGFTGPYTLPGTRLFLDFCANLVARYKLGALVRKATVVSVELIPDSVEASPDCADSVQGPCRFLLTLDDGSRVRAERVVCAMGPGPMFTGMRANMPWWYEGALASLRDAGVGCIGGADGGDAELPRLCHSSQLVRELLARGDPAKRRLRGVRVLVVGGGQTAGHLCLVALNNGAAAVCLAARRRIVRKPFDVDLELIGERRGSVLGRFWGMGQRERLAFIKRVRGGGSMAQEVHDALRGHVAGEGGGGEGDGADSGDDGVSERNGLGEGGVSVGDDIDGGSQVESDSVNGENGENGGGSVSGGDIGAGGARDEGSSGGGHVAGAGGDDGEGGAGAAESAIDGGSHTAGDSGAGGANRGSVGGSGRPGAEGGGEGGSDVGNGGLKVEGGKGGEEEGGGGREAGAGGGGVGKGGKFAPGRLRIMEEVEVAHATWKADGGGAPALPMAPHFLPHLAPPHSVRIRMTPFPLPPRPLLYPHPHPSPAPTPKALLPRCPCLNPPVPPPVLPASVHPATPSLLHTPRPHTRVLLVPARYYSPPSAAARANSLSHTPFPSFPQTRPPARCTSASTTAAVARSISSGWPPGASWTCPSCHSSTR